MANESIIIKENGVETAVAAAETSASKKQAADLLKPRRKADPYILGIYLLFIVISVIEIFSASSTEWMVICYEDKCY